MRAEPIVRMPSMHMEHAYGGLYMVCNHVQQCVLCQLASMSDSASTCSVWLAPAEYPAAAPPLITRPEALLSRRAVSTDTARVVSFTRTVLPGNETATCLSQMTIMTALADRCNSARMPA